MLAAGLIIQLFCSPGIDRKLGSLEQEQTDLMGVSYDIKVGG